MAITSNKIRSLYIEYNKKYFDGCLYMPKISTYSGDTSMGLFFVRKWKNRTEEEILIARNFKLTKEELRDLILHEMIHQYVYEKYGKMNHGRHFKRKMKEFNEKYGFDIRKNSKHLFRKYKGKRTIWEKIMTIIKAMI